MVAAAYIASLRAMGLTQHGLQAFAAIACGLFTVLAAQRKRGI